MELASDAGALLGDGLARTQLALLLVARGPRDERGHLHPARPQRVAQAPGGGEHEPAGDRVAQADVARQQAYQIDGDPPRADEPAHDDGAPRTRVRGQRVERDERRDPALHGPLIGAVHHSCVRLDLRLQADRREHHDEHQRRIAAAPQQRQADEQQEDRVETARPRDAALE